MLCGVGPISFVRVLITLLLSLRVFLRRYPLFVLMFCVASGAVLVPVWGATFLPFLDWPQHVGMVSFLRHRNDFLWGFSSYVELRGQLVATYLIFYYLSTFFAYFMKVEEACTLTLSLYLVGTPMAAVFMLRSFRLPPWPSLFLFVAVYNWPLFMGFLPYVQSFPLILLGLGLMKQFTYGVTPRRWWSMVVVTLLLFLSHVFAYLVLGFLAVVIALLFRFRSLQQRFYACLSWVPSMGLMALWGYQLLLSRSGGPALQKVASGHGGTGSGFWQATYRSSFEKLYGLLDHFNEAFVGDIDRKILWFWLGCFVWCMLWGVVFRVTRWWRYRPNDRWPWWEGFLIVVAMTALYYAMPMGLFGVWWALSPRLVPLIGILLILALPPATRGTWRNAFLYLPILLLVVWTGQVHQEKFQAFDKEAKGITKVLAAVPRGARLYGLMFDPTSRVITEAAYLHFPVYSLVQRGGMVGFSHFHYTVMPGKFKNIALAPYPGHRAEWEPWRWKYLIYGPFYDYILTRGYGVWSQTGAPRGRMQELIKDGKWAVYANPSAHQQWPLFSFRENLYKAKVWEQGAMLRRPCLRQKGARFECPYAPWVVVQPVQVHMSRVYIPCIWAHPANGKTIQIEFKDLPASGNRIAGILGIADTGLTNGHSHGTPVSLVVKVQGKFVARIKSMARAGYIPYEIKLPSLPFKDPLSVTFEVSSPSDSKRHFCFTGTLFQKF